MTDTSHKAASQTLREIASWLQGQNQGLGRSFGTTGKRKGTYEKTF